MLKLKRLRSDMKKTVDLIKKFFPIKNIFLLSRKKAQKKPPYV